MTAPVQKSSGAPVAQAAILRVRHCCDFPYRVNPAAHYARHCAIATGAGAASWFTRKRRKSEATAHLSVGAA